MPTVEELLEAVATMAAQPKVSVAGNFRKENQSIGDLVKAAELVAGLADEESPAQPHRGIRLTRLISPGTQ